MSEHWDKSKSFAQNIQDIKEDWKVLKDEEGKQSRPSSATSPESIPEQGVTIPVRRRRQSILKENEKVMGAKEFFEGKEYVPRRIKHRREANAQMFKEEILGRRREGGLSAIVSDYRFGKKDFPVVGNHTGRSIPS